MKLPDLSAREFWDVVKETFWGLWHEIKVYITGLIPVVALILEIEKTISKEFDKYQYPEIMEHWIVPILKHIPLLFIGFFILYFWKKVAGPLSELQKQVKEIRETSYQLAFANLVKKIESKAIFDVNRCINEVEGGGPQYGLYACDINSPYDWLTNDVLAYDAVFRNWLRESKDRELHRILVWPQKDFISDIGLKVIEIQWMNAYNLYVLFTEDLYKVNREMFPDKKVGTSNLNFVVWDIFQVGGAKGSCHPGRTEKNKCFGFRGEQNREGNQPEYFIKFMSQEERSNYTKLWKHLQTMAKPISELIGTHPDFRDKPPLPVPGNFIEPGLRSILKRQLEELIEEKSAERGLPLQS